MQIFNQNPQMICSLIVCQEIVIDLVTHTSPIKSGSQLIHTQILNKNQQLS